MKTYRIIVTYADGTVVDYCAIAASYEQADRMALWNHPSALSWGVVRR